MMIMMMMTTTMMMMMMLMMLMMMMGPPRLCRGLCPWPPRGTAVAPGAPPLASPAPKP